MTDDFPITIFHNPDYGTSRNALAMILMLGSDRIMPDGSGKT